MSQSGGTGAAAGEAAVVVGGAVVVVMAQNTANHEISQGNLQENAQKQDEAKGESGTQHQGESYSGERNPQNDFTNSRGESTLEKHASKHGYDSAEEYLNDARNFLEKEPTSSTESFVSKAGTYFQYDRSTNEFGIINEYGGISTYFKPETGIEYWLMQIELYAPQEMIT